MQAELITRKMVKPPERPHGGVTRGRLTQFMNSGPQSRELKQFATSMNGRGGGLPGSLKTGIESLSRISMDSVRVHYNSSSPAQLRALAYAQGADIHLAPGQEKHLAHEAWHVVQQAQGRVRPTMVENRLPVNDDRGLESEADSMGARALSMGEALHNAPEKTAAPNLSRAHAVQRQEMAPQSNADKGPALLALVGKLQETVDIADHIAASKGTASPAPGLAGKLVKIREIALGHDAPLKTRTLAALRAELADVGPAPALESSAAKQVVQRVSLGGGLVIGAGIIGFGLLVRGTYRFLRDRHEDTVLATYRRTRRVPNGGAIPAELNDGLAALAGAAQAARLFRNVNNFRFRYTGVFVPPAVALAARQGDCQTLVGIYRLVAAANGLATQTHREDRRMLVASAPIHGRSAQFNTDPAGLQVWTFGEHTWVAAAGTSYDVLFMVTPPPAVAIAGPVVIRRGVRYYPFPDGRCLIRATEVALLVPIAGSGRVFANVGAVQAFIDANTAAPAAAAAAGGAH